MKIVIDCRYTRFDHHDGISRYTTGIVTALSKLHPLTMLISDHRQLAFLPDLPWELVNPPTSILEPFIALRVNHLQPDIVFSPMQTMGSFRRRYALVLTVHDLIYYRHHTPPRNLPVFIRLLWRLYHLTWWPQRFLLNRADAVATVSETTRALIAKNTLTYRPVTVIPNAPSTAVTTHHTHARQQPAKTLIYMGSFMPYKNVDNLIRAAAFLPEYTLHLVSPISNHERHRLTMLAPQTTIVFHNGVTDNNYCELLSNATALVTASKDEGFGIPLVEAMSLGTPIAVSDIPIFREIGGTAAVYFNPNNPHNIAETIRTIAHNWQERSQLAYTQAAHYTWEKSAIQLLRLLKTTNTNRHK